MLKKLFIKNIYRLGISRYDKILLAVSGGADSIVMAHLFVTCKFDVAIAHCNFSLRGKDSDMDELFVKNFAKKNNLPVYCIKFDTKKYSAANKISIEMAARDLRYQWFEKLRIENGFTKIATAHNLNDVAETFFLNLSRGSGIKGLCGIAENTETIIRPLLFASRRQIEKYAEQHNIDFCTDATNFCDEFTRNKIRLNIIPEFERINPSFLKTMQQNINNIEQGYKTLQNLKPSVEKKTISTKNNKTIIDINKLKLNENNQFWLFEILSKYGFNSSTIHEIANSVDSQSGKTFFSQSHVLIKNRNNFIISELHKTNEKTVKIDENTVDIKVPLPLKFEKIINFDSQICKDKNCAFLNLDKIKFPITLRKWQHGDNFTPFGMKGKMKLSDFFINIKLSKFEKEEQYVLVSDEKIIWVVERRIDDFFKIDDKCKNVLKITKTEK